MRTKDKVVVVGIGLLLAYGLLKHTGVLQSAKNIFSKIDDEFINPVFNPPQDRSELINIIQRLGFNYAQGDNAIYVYSPDGKTTLRIADSDINKTAYIKRRATYVMAFPSFIISQQKKFNWVFA